MFFKWILFLVLLSSDALANRMDSFRGWHEILSSDAGVQRKEWFLLDVDSLENIWQRYGEGKLPDDWIPVKDEIGVLAGFTNRQALLLTMESNFLVGDNFASVFLGNGLGMEIRRRPDGTSDMAFQENRAVSRYWLAPPRAAPDGALLGLPPTPALR
ncbi:MAG: hypothetical protein HUU37_03710 [Bdellovibrionales bacterium]|nr:hypothetical protein [Bdellovibrionales bacterium]